MPPRFNSDVELSLRHLPDLSDASFSFQIPTLSKGDLLLGDDEDEDDFFKNADDHLTTPGPSRPFHAPLTLNELTPKPRPKSEIFSTQSQQQGPLLSSIPAAIMPSEPNPTIHLEVQGIKKVPNSQPAPELRKPSLRPKLKVATHTQLQARSGEASPAAARLKNLKVQVDMLNDEPCNHNSNVASTSTQQDDTEFNPVHPSSISQVPETQEVLSSKRERERIVTKPITKRQTVIAGGISKTRGKKKASSMLSLGRGGVMVVSGPKIQPPPQAAASEPVRHIRTEITELDDSSADLSICSTTMSGGVAERLVMYSQRLIHSFGRPNPNPDQATSTSTSTDSDTKISPSPEGDVVITPESTAGAIIASPDDRPTRDDKDEPLTVSQLSPLKRMSPLPSSFLPATSANPASPMRPSSKRPVAPALDRAHKKGRMGTATSTSGYAVDVPALKTKPEMHIPATGSSSSSGSGSTSGSNRASTSTGTRMTTKTQEMTKIREKVRETTKTRTRGAVAGKSTAETRQEPRGKPGDNHTQRLPVPFLAQSEAGSSSGSGSASSRLRDSRVNDDDDDDGHATRVVTSTPVLPSTTEGETNTASAALAGADQCTGSSSEGALEKKRDKEPVLPSANPTKPIGFKFQLDARVEARKTEHEETTTARGVLSKANVSTHPHQAQVQAQSQSQSQSRPQSQSQSHSRSQSRSQSQSSHPHRAHRIPDFKALHAQHSASLASLKQKRKENLHPTVPLPIATRELSTGERARARERFDREVRERERVEEARREAVRREREEEEEREVREMRRRAVPRAHEVPEWYREAPKRSLKEGG